MNRPVHFEIHAGDADRAIAFYTRTFGWSFQKWDGPVAYWIIRTGEGTGIDGGMVMRMGDPPAEGAAVNSYVNTVKVTSCDEAVAAIVANGGTIAHPKMAIPGMGWLAYGKDTEGNLFGVMNDDPQAR